MSALSSQGHDPRRDPGARRMAQIAQHLRDLSSRDQTAATEAGARLNDLAPTHEELVELIGDRNPFVRSGTAWWLRNLTGEVPPSLVNALRAAIYDPNSHVVQAALGSAGVLRLEITRDDVRNCLEDSNPGVVHSAIFALGRIGPSEEGQHLVRFLHDTEYHLEAAAVSALTQLRYRPAIADLIQRLEACCGAVRRHRPDFELPRRYLIALVALDAREAIPLLVRVARDEIGLRGLAVQALIDLKATEAAPPLVPLLSQLLHSVNEERLCASLLHLMTEVDYRFAMPQVRAFLGHRLGGVRGAALKAVARWKDGEAVPAVRAMARDDPSAFVRPTAVLTLVELLGEESLDDLVALAGDANTLVRAAVAEALGKMPSPSLRAQELLRFLAGDETGTVARNAREALDKQPGVAPPPPAPPSTSLLPADLREQAPAARAFLARWKEEVSRLPEPERAGADQALTTLLKILESEPAG